MPEFFTGVWEHIQFFRLEIAGAVFLLVAEVIRRRYSQNKRVIAFLDMLQEQAAKLYEKQNAQPLADSASKKRKLRRKIRRQLAKESRKMNRNSSKGQKRGQ